MSASLVILAAIVATVTAWFTYGRFVARRLQISDANPTPAHTMADGVDYVPAKAPVLLGHHFASIAGASPIIGPIVAIVFGWLPALIWLLVGAIFMGAVHDFVSLVASARHQGRSIGEVIEEYVGVTGKRLFGIFAFATLVLVIAVFTHVVAKGFAVEPGTEATLHGELRSGAVATTHTSFIVLALLFGAAVYRLRVPLLPATAIGVAGLFGCVMLGMAVPITLGYTAWVVIILIYCVIAAILPVQALLQPRDYLNSFLLYLLMAGGIIGLLVTSLTSPATTAIQREAIGPLVDPKLGFIFPILFVTIACGAISGFHSLVASGTTSKQLDKESDAKIIGYGGMLIESCLGALSLAAVATLGLADYSAAMGAGGPIAVFEGTIGAFIGTLGVDVGFARTFVGLAVSAFALTSLDTCTRLARFMFQEFFAQRTGRPAPAVRAIETHSSATLPAARALLVNRWTGTILPVVLGGALTLSGQFGRIWPIFGAANQLLAALALCAGAVWLSRKGVRNTFLLVPMGFMFAVTLSALGVLFANAVAPGDDQNLILAALTLLLFALAAVVLAQSIAVLRRGRNAEDTRPFSAATLAGAEA